MKRIAIVGGGLTGPLLAAYLAKRDYEVTVFERNHDPRTTAPQRGKSINITLCTRGFAALERVGVASAVREICVPARGRYIHNADGSYELQPYGNDGEALYSVSRRALNRVLLDHASLSSRVTFRFDAKCVGFDLDAATMTFEDGRTGDRFHATADHVMAADGARSFLRRELQKRDRFNFAQFYSEHGNKELPIPAGSRAEWHKHKNALHIWPRGQYMLIAFPNLDGSFTSTLHLPLEGEVSFDSIHTERDLVKLFETSFPDAYAEMPNVVSDYFANPTIPMVTIRCAPWNHRDKVLLIGDAAHAIWPSYGQGANAGFEDCAILDECLEEQGGDWLAATRAYQERRKPDVEAVADLSEEHFREIRDKVGDPAFLLRKRVERKFNRMYPERYSSLYSLVAFTTTPYAEALRMNQAQNKLVDAVLSLPDIEARLDSSDVERYIHALMTS
jgi:kynurenine 3-monooxygenase